MSFMTSGPDSWQSFIVEVSLFVVTVAFALILKNTPARRKSKKPKQEWVHDSTVEGNKENCPEKTLASSGFVFFGSGNIRAAVTERQRYQGAEGLALAIDEAISHVQRHQGYSAARTLLAAYAGMPAELKNLNIAEVMQLKVIQTRHDVVPRRTRYSPVDFYAMLIRCALHVGRFHLLEGTLDDMAQQGVSLSLLLYGGAMKQFVRSDNFNLVLSMYDRILAQGLELSERVYGVLVSFAIDLDELERPIVFFERLCSISTPSTRAYMQILGVHAKRHDWPASLAIFHDMRRRGVEIDSPVLNVITETGVAAEEMEGVEALLSEANEMTPPILDIVSYNTLIKAYAHRNDAANAAKVIDIMLERGLAPNAVSFNTAMYASARSCRCAEAHTRLLELAEAHNLSTGVPTKESTASRSAGGPESGWWPDSSRAPPQKPWHGIRQPTRGRTQLYADRWSVANAEAQESQSSHGSSATPMGAPYDRKWR